ncbi:hypothetical protein H5410_051617 [Solanum commersonii]|uniref:Uncharacterized protein n=1 Tax=Solanum commersonii TaxID=4109 RepID=A0A9J5X193_SOLCO|nr:hypothetical protein H5410_051617 [Solanum commersonii]
MKREVHGQAITSVPSQVLTQFINMEDIASTLHTVQSYLMSLPEQYPSQQSGLHSNSTTSLAQTLAKLIFDFSIRLHLEAFTNDSRKTRKCMVQLLFE